MKKLTLEESNQEEKWYNAGWKDGSRETYKAIVPKRKAEGDIYNNPDWGFTATSTDTSNYNEIIDQIKKNYKEFIE
jgi:hypothetical protein